MKIYSVYIYSTSNTHYFSTKKLAMNFVKSLLGEGEEKDSIDVNECFIDETSIETPLGRTIKRSTKYCLAPMTKKEKIEAGIEE